MSMKPMKPLFLYLIWINSLIAMAGSLFFSEVLNFPPCSLCWYQRIFMFPLILILGVALITQDLQVRKYILPFILGGIFISLYHNLIYYQIIPEIITTCRSGVPCTEKQIEILGFISIPLLSFTNFAISFTLLGIDYLLGVKNEK